MIASLELPRLDNSKERERISKELTRAIQLWLDTGKPVRVWLAGPTGETIQ